MESESTYQWDRIIGSIVGPRVRVAEHLGSDRDDLLQVGRLAALEAEASWTPSGGRSLPSWVYYMVACTVRDYLRGLSTRVMSEYEEGRLVGALPLEYESDARAVARNALDLLRASLPEPMWAALWLRHAEGADVDELAQHFGTTNTAIRQRLTYARTRSLTILGFPL